MYNQYLASKIGKHQSSQPTHIELLITLLAIIKSIITKYVQCVKYQTFNNITFIAQNVKQLIYLYGFASSKAWAYWQIEKNPATSKLVCHLIQKSSNVTYIVFQKKILYIFKKSSTYGKLLLQPIPFRIGLDII